MYLGIDLGTSAVKACVINDAGKVIASTTSPLDISHPFDGACEQHCADWWNATVDAIRQIEASVRHHIQAIGLSGQMHGAVVLGADKRPLRSVILWNDTRAEHECRDLEKTMPEIGQVSGVLPMPGFTAPKLLWLSKHEPAVHAKIRHVLLPKDYIGMCLHGELVTDPSDAAGTSLLNQKRVAWDQRLCDASHTNIAWLPEIKTGTSIAGQLMPSAADQTGLPVHIPVVAGAGDAAAGAIGIGAVGDNEGFISLGTSGQLFVTTAAYAPNPHSRIHAYAHTIPDKWFQMAAMLNGARPMAWLAGILGAPIEVLLKEAENAEPGPIFLPYLTGERTPHGDSNIRGGFAMLGETTDRGSLMRGVVEGIAFTFADAFSALATAGTVPHRLFAIGGGAKSAFLMQTISNVTNCKIECSTSADLGPAVGAARLAAVGHLQCALEDWAKVPKVEASYEPIPSQRATTEERLLSFRSLYPAIRSWQKKTPP